MQERHLIVGLGNPGPRYRATRHNAGFMVVERLAAEAGLEWRSDHRFRSRLAAGRWQDRPVLLVEPLTYMNASGEAVGPLVRYYRTPLERLLVVVDDADLPLGRLRLRPGGSSGGHHGLESVERHLGTREFPRLRVGIGRRPEAGREITNHVLGVFSPAEREWLEPVLDRAVAQIGCWLTRGIAEAMNRYNGIVPILNRNEGNEA
ncbi:MAG: aminoacyl-tRNA hydrolase [Verrucomicrobia bacterium]|nr:MAG: aminoacyl-tRNA hydrolase [Verrucomicrobiota bacterium]